jgi:hypothetical protein
MPAPEDNQRSVAAAQRADVGGHATDELLPAVYDDLRRLAEHHLAQERAGHTLQATAVEETAAALQISTGLAAREWQFARLWLCGQLAESEGRMRSAEGVERASAEGPA